MLKWLKSSIFPAFSRTNRQNAPLLAVVLVCFGTPNHGHPHHRHAKDRPHGSALWRRRPAHLGRVVAGGAGSGETGLKSKRYYITMYNTMYNTMCNYTYIYINLKSSTMCNYIYNYVCGETVGKCWEILGKPKPFKSQQNRRNWKIQRARGIVEHLGKMS